MSDIAVIGAGIAGATTAYQLARRGHAVTLFDRHGEAAAEASHANGGQLSACNAEVWTSWATLRQGLKWILQAEAPLRVQPAPTWHKLSWLAGFVRAIPRYEENTVTLARLAVSARAHLLQTAEDEGIEFDLLRRGILHVHQTEAEFRHAEDVTRLLARAGVERRAVTPAEIRGLEPALEGSFHGGFYTPDDFTGDAAKFAAGLVAAAQRMGAVLRLGTTVADMKATEAGVSILEEGGEEHHVARVVICAGVGSRRLAAMLGDRVNVYPVKGYSVTVHLDEEAARRAAPWMSLHDDGAKIVTSRLGADRYRVAGTAELTGDDRRIHDARIRPLLAWCRRRLPAMPLDRVTPWAGLRPMMPDLLPRVGRGRRPGVYYNTGHGHLGWTLAAATAELVAGVIDADSGVHEVETP